MTRIRQMLWALDLTLLLLVSVACSPPQRNGRDSRSLGATDRDTAVTDAETSGSASRAENRPDAGAEAGVGEPQLPSGQLVAKAQIQDTDAEVRIEKIEGSYAIRIKASLEVPLSVEPTVDIDGPTRAGAFFGPGCQRAQKGRSKVIGLWDGTFCYSAIAAAPQAVILDREVPLGCPIKRAEPGMYGISLYQCGQYNEPLVTVRFEVSAPSKRVLDDEGSYKDSDDTSNWLRPPEFHKAEVR